MLYCYAILDDFYKLFSLLYCVVILFACCLRLLGNGFGYHFMDGLPIAVNPAINIGEGGTQGRSERGCGVGGGGVWHPKYLFFSRHLEPRSANEASTVEQGLVQNNLFSRQTESYGFADCKCIVFLNTEYFVCYSLSFVHLPPPPTHPTVKILATPLMSVGNSDVTMGGALGNVPPTEVCAPPPPGVPPPPLCSEFWKIGSHLRLQDTKCSSSHWHAP